MQQIIVNPFAVMQSVSFTTNIGKGKTIMEEIKFTCNHCGQNALVPLFNFQTDANLEILDLNIKLAYKAIRLMEEKRMQLQEQMKKGK